MKPHISIVIGSIREGRFGDKPAAWLYERLRVRDDMTVNLIDVKDHPLPLFAEPQSPKYVQGEYRLPEVNAWATHIARADGYIFVTPEYNHGYSAALKNNIDYLYKEWGRKPIAYLGYGLSGGASAISQLRTVATELEMVPMRTEIYVRDPWNLVDQDGSLKAGALDMYAAVADRQIVELLWWARALWRARNA